MTDDMMELARRAVACEGWRWMPGILRLSSVSPAMPDLTDPATLGCVLALVAERHGVNMEDVYTSKVGGGGWSVWVVDGEEQRCAWPQWRVTYSTRRAALVAALEASPVGGSQGVCDDG